MAELKKRILTLDNGRQIKLYGNSIAISKSFEIAEGYAPNILSCQTDTPTSGKATLSVSNPFKLTKEELMEIADYNIRLWMDFKDNIRKHGVADPKIFNKEAML